MYVEPAVKWLRPNLAIVAPSGEILWQSNALRLKGPDVENDAPIAVVWGDSVVFGCHERGWPEMLNDYAENYTFLNGGFEGIGYVDVLSRVVEFNRTYRVSFNVVFPGWYPTDGNREFGTHLNAALEHIPHAVLLTLPTCLNEGMIDSDISSFFRRGSGPNDMFTFWGADGYSIAEQKQLFAHVRQRNDIIRKVAEHTKTPLVDLFAALDSSRLADFREEFFDVSHPRPSAYGKFASVLWEGIAPLISGAEPKRSLR